MKTYIFKHSLLGVILGLSILGCTEGDKFDYNKNMAFITGTETTPVTKLDNSCFLSSEKIKLL